ncbi:MAG: DUF6935 domain-containing protein, partial [Capnocytophaga granulosa]
MIKNLLKKIPLAAMVIALFVTGCEKEEDPDKGKVKGTDIEVTMTGEISEDTYTKGQKATISFSRFPSSVAEFKAVRERIGTTPQGAIALEVMAMEMYRKDRAVGEECLKLCNVKSNVRPIIRRLKELFGEDEGYARPYQMMAFLKGATPYNKYTPDTPYTVEIEVHPVNGYQNSEIYGTNVLYLNLKTSGSQSVDFMQVAVLKTKNKEEMSAGRYYLVQSNGGMYTQVMSIQDGTKPKPDPNPTPDPKPNPDPK